MSALVGPFPEGADPDAYDRLRRRVLWSLPTGLYLIGSAGELDGELRHNLMTANLVLQVATDPKLVAVAVEHEALTRRLIEAGAAFAVSVLRREDRATVRRFVKPVTELVMGPDGRPTEMAGHAVLSAPSGSPVLAWAASWIDCRLHALQPLGSHDLCIGEVVAVEGPKDGEPAEILRMEDTKMNYGG